MGGMDTPEMQITDVLMRVNNGEKAANDELFDLVYDQLREMAAAKFRHEPAGNTLQPTALVHEVYQRLTGPRDIPWKDRVHFFRTAARAMRQVLCSQARSRIARKLREDRPVAGALRDLSALLGETPETILALDRSLARLSNENPEVYEVVMLRFFAGRTNEETAELLGISASTVKRSWAMARARLYRLMIEEGVEMPGE